MKPFRIVSRYSIVIVALIATTFLTSCNNEDDITDPTDPSDSTHAADTNPGIYFLSKDTTRAKQNLFGIYRMNADGSNRRLLRMIPDVPYARTASYVNISPNNEHGFIALTDGMYLFRVSGGEAVRIGNRGNGSHWSPDGKKFLFFEYSYNPDWRRIYVINSDGTNKHLLREDAAISAWSPDGQTILYGGNDGKTYSITPDGNNEKLLFSEGANSFRFSPDGSKIAYNRNEFDSVESVYISNSDGTGQYKVVSSSWKQGRYEVSDWSPDSKKIYIVSPNYSSGTAQCNIYQFNNLDKSFKPLFNKSFGEYWAKCSPDGNKMVLQTYVNTDKILIVNLDGTESKDLTPDNKIDRILKWVK